MVARISRTSFFLLLYNFMFNLPKSFCILFSCYHDDYYTHTHSSNVYRNVTQAPVN
jgi:hypothetical protein